MGRGRTGLVQRIPRSDSECQRFVDAGEEKLRQDERSVGSDGYAHCLLVLQVAKAIVKTPPHKNVPLACGRGAIRFDCCFGVSSQFDCVRIDRVVESADVSAQKIAGPATKRSFGNKKDS